MVTVHCASSSVLYIAGKTLCHRLLYYVKIKTFLYIFMRLQTTAVQCYNIYVIFNNFSEVK